MLLVVLKERMTSLANAMCGLRTQSKHSSKDGSRMTWRGIGYEYNVKMGQ